MNRRQFLFSAFALGVGQKIQASGHGATAFGRLSPAQPAAPPVTRFEELRRGVGMFIGNGGTIGYLLNGDGAIAVDSQFMNTAELCIEGLKPRTPKGIELLINTHHHGDHTGGNRAFKAVVKNIVCQENCLAWHKKVSEQNKTAADQAYADLSFGESWSRVFGDEKVWAHYYGAGHTSGDAVVTFEKANVVHGGDLLFKRVHPRIDGVAGGTAKNWIKVLDKMVKAHANDTVYVFGHAQNNAPQGTKADVIFFKDYLSAAVDHVEKGHKARKSKDEVTKVEALKGFESVTAFSANLTLANTLGVIYDEVSR
jgi:glyoxylase-like metal-dependent hydrolase (beta-lactamase superfamily II)